MHPVLVRLDVSGAYPFCNGLGEVAFREAVCEAHDNSFLYSSVAFVAAQCFDALFIVHAIVQDGNVGYVEHVAPLDGVIPGQSGCSVEYCECEEPGGQIGVRNGVHCVQVLTDDTHVGTELWSNDSCEGSDVCP